jgi:hypothetical protein
VGGCSSEDLAHSIKGIDEVH